MFLENMRKPFETIQIRIVGDRPGARVKTHVSHAEDLKSNPILEVVTYGFKKSYDDDYRKVP